MVMKKKVAVLFPLFSFSLALVPGCGGQQGKQNVCEPGKQIECACINNAKGIQACLSDGSAWGDCQCPCSSNIDCSVDEYCDFASESCKPSASCDHTLQCADKCCGDDGCGKSAVCENTCTSGTYCNPTSCRCEDGCSTNNDCLEDQYCDPTSGKCETIPCDHEQNCTDKCCGDDGCGTGARCEDKCVSGTTCDPSSCTCVLDDCCPGQDLFITVDGIAMDLASRQGVQAGVAAMAPLTALSGDIDTHLAEASAAATGVFHLSCFDVSTVSLGLLLLVDDPGFDGPGGNFFPTITGIAGYLIGEDKECENAATAMVINNQLQAALDQIHGLDKNAVGYIIGVVTDANHVPLEGATVVKGDGSALDNVLYPNAYFTAFDGAATSANGVYLIPTQLGLTPLMGVKDGYTWSDNIRAATIPGAAYFVPLVAN